MVLMILLFWASFFATIYLTNYIYYGLGWHPDDYSALDTYPFNCHKCMTTNTLIAVYIMEGLLLGSIPYTIFGLVLSGLFGYGLYKTEKERFEE